MALMKSLNSGVSGLRSFQKKIDVIGNNIANVETTGFKSSRVTFSEMFSQNMGGTGGSSSAPQLSNHIGLGVKVSAISRNFEQGGINTTGVGTDLALEGEGFFMVADGKQQYLTRAGNFAFNKEGYLVTQSGLNVQGFNADAAGNILSGGATEDIRVDFESVSPPKVTENVYIAGNLGADTSVAQVVQAQTSFTTTSGTLADSGTDLNDLSQTSTPLTANDTIEFDITLNDGTPTTVTHTYAAGDTLGDVAATINTALGAEGSVALVDGLLVFRSSQIGDTPFNVTGVTFNDVDVDGSAISFPGFGITQEGTTGTKTVSSTIYDSMGRAHTLLLEFTQDSATQWSYEARFLDGETINSGAIGTGALQFSDQGNLTSGSTINIDFNPGGGAGAVNFTVNLGDPEAGIELTQFAGSSTAKTISQDGYTQGQLVDFQIDGGGYINGVYDNGQNIQLGQVAVADVTNVNGLEPEGSGLFRTSMASGQVTISTAESLSGTDIKSGALEGSNVDLAKSFTELMTAQRAYQSSARIITTADDLLAEVVNLKR